MRVGRGCIETLRALSGPAVSRGRLSQYETIYQDRLPCYFYRQPVQRAFLSNKRRRFAVYTTPSPQILPSRFSRHWNYWRREGDVQDLVKEAIEKEPTEELEREISWLAQHKPHLPAIEALLSYMITERHVQPTAEHYEALILANCDPVHGSLHHALAVAEDMRQNSLWTSSVVDSALLRVLAIHPNPGLRKATIDRINNEWTSVPNSTKWLVVAALIREGQIDAARLELQNAQRSGILIPAWVEVMMAHVLCERKDYTALISLLYELFDREVELPRTTWLHLLRETAKDGHIESVSWIWQKHVQPAFISPDAECCKSVVELAFKRGDIVLGSNAQALLRRLDYTTLVQGNEDLDGAFEDSGESKTPGTRLRGLHCLLKDTPWPEDAIFDPKEAMAKRPLERFFNQKRRARIKSWNEYINNRFREPSRHETQVELRRHARPRFEPAIESPQARR